MRRYIIRIFLLLLLAAAAAAVMVYASGVPRGQAAAELPPPEVLPPQPEAEVLPQKQLRLQSETPRESISIYADDWTPQASLRLDAAGSGTVERPAAGGYRLIRADGRVVRFCLDETGGISVTEGAGYGSGDVLMLTEEKCGSVELRYHAADAAGVLCRLESGSGVTSGAFVRRDAETACLTFPGLKAGRYRVFVGGEWVITVELSEHAMERCIELY